MDKIVQYVNLISSPMHVLFKDASMNFINIKCTTCFLTQLKFGLNLYLFYSFQNLFLFLFKYCWWVFLKCRENDYIIKWLILHLLARSISLQVLQVPSRQLQEVYISFITNLFNWIHVIDACEFKLLFIEFYRIKDSRLTLDVNDGPPAPKFCKLLSRERYCNQCYDENGKLLDNLDFDYEQPIYQLPLHPNMMSKEEKIVKHSKLREEAYKE